ncbi:MAG: hypothetical protein Q7U91_05720 [Sideroxyarcus sp.]|nr:hypothetical protein [Sideroxyarcus sp.]
MENSKDSSALTRLIRATLFLCAFAFAGFSHSKDDVEPGLPLLLGDYLSVEYIDLLRQTRSPIAAGSNSDHRQYIKTDFDTNERLIDFTLMGNFHEGLGGIIADTSLLVIEEDFGETPAKLKVMSRFEFIVEVDGKTLVYHYVGNYKQFIARNTIAGQYKDKKGGLYTFTEEGIATFPDHSFRYEVDADFGMISFDTFFEVLPQYPFAGTQYGFKLFNNKLQIFEMGGPMGNEPEPNPFVTLTRIEDAEAKP